MVQLFYATAQAPKLIEETDKFIAISNKQKDKLRDLGVDSSKISLIPNGVDTDNFNPKIENKDNTQILTVARLAPEKNLRKALKSINLLNSKTDEEFVYKIVGDGGKRKELENLAIQKDIENVEFVGFKKRKIISEIMANSDIFLLTSNEETLPTVLIEAHSSALPVVSTNVGSVNEIVEHNETGFLEDDVEKISQKLKTLIENESLRSKMGKKGRTKIEESFSKKRNNQKMDKLYRKLIKND